MMILDSHNGDYVRLNFNEPVPAGYTQIQGLGDSTTGIAVRDDLVNQVRALDYGRNVRYSHFIEIREAL